MTAADLEAVLSIQKASPGAAQWPADEWRIFCGQQDALEYDNLRTGYHAWVADEEGAVVGFLAGLFSGEELEILNLAVASGARRTGIASALLSEALAAARKSGGGRVFLEVRASNAGAIVFYQGHGFLPAGLRNNYYREPLESALVLARKI
jgi:ribosomal protein S18 acetylase RimI-like enzyme